MVPSNCNLPPAMKFPKASDWPKAETGFPCHTHNISSQPPCPCQIPLQDSLSLHLAILPTHAPFFMTQKFNRTSAHLALNAAPFINDLSIVSNDTAGSFRTSAPLPQHHDWLKDSIRLQPAL